MTEKVWRPHWSTWLHAEEVTLWEGVLLCHDIDPSRHGYDAGKLKRDAYSSDPDLRVWTSVERRLLVALRAVRPGGRLRDYLYPSSHDVRVPLVHFVEWATSVGWDDMPNELAQLANQDARLSKAGRWPWGDYETKPLGVMAEAVHQLWSTFDPDEPETAPTQPDVVGFITKRLKEVGYANPDAIATAMATIIRHERAPIGRRRKAQR